MGVFFDKGSKSAGKGRSGGLFFAIDGEGATPDTPPEKGKGFFDIGPIGAAREVLGGGGNLVLEGLSKLDIPRAAIVAGSLEIADGLREVTGKAPRGNSKNIRDTGFSWEDFKVNVGNHVGVGDIVEREAPDMPWAGKAALGFTGDVLLDPLTYLTAGATTAAKAGGKGSRLLFKDQVATRINQLPDDVVERLGGRDAVRKVADDVRGDSSGRLAEHPLTAKAIGATAGINFAGHSLPGTGRMASRTAKMGGGVKRAVTKRTWDNLSDETRAKWERIPGHSAVVEATGSKARGLQYINGSRNATSVSRSWGTNRSNEFEQLYKLHADADWDEARRIVEDGAATATSEGRAAVDVSEWLEATRLSFKKVTGKDLPKLENYFPRALTGEAIDRLKSKSGRAAKAGSPLERRVLRPGENFLGEVLESGSIDEVRSISKRVLGDERIELFLDDPRAIFGGYIKALSREMREAVFMDNLRQVDLLQYVDEVGPIAQKRQNKAVVKQIGKLDKKENLRSSAADRLARIDERLDEETRLVDELNDELDRIPDDTNAQASPSVASTGAAGQRGSLPPVSEAKVARTPSEVTDRLYREVNLGAAESYLPDSRVYDQSVRRDYFTNDPDLAIGQGNNNGVLFEFDTATIGAAELRPNPKPGWQATWDAGSAEFTMLTAPKHLGDSVRAITIRKGAVTGASKGERVSLKRHLDRLEGEGWTKTKDAEGNTHYRRPDVEDTSEANAGREVDSQAAASAQAQADSLGDELADAEATLASRAQDLTDLKKTAKGTKNKRAMVPDEVYENLSDDVADLDFVNREARMAEADLPYRFDVAAKTLAADPEYAMKPALINQVKAWERQALEVSEITAALDEGAQLTPARLAEYETMKAEVEKATRTLEGIEKRFELDAGGPKLQDTDRIPEADQQVKLAEAAKAAAKATRDELKKRKAQLDAASGVAAKKSQTDTVIAKVANDGPATEAVVRNSISPGEANYKAVEEAEAALEAARLAKKGVAAAQKELARTKRGYAKVQKMLEEAKVVEAEEWSGLNSLNTVQSTSPGQLREANDELAARLTGELEAASGRKRALLEDRVEAAGEADRLFRAAERHAARGEDVKRQLAELEGLKHRRLAEAADPYSDVQLNPLTIAQERQLQDIGVGQLQQTATHQNLWGDPAVIDAINAWQRFGNTRGTGPFGKFYDLALSRWKAQALLSPGYHGRNFMTAVFMNHLAGMNGGMWHEWRHFRRIARANRKGGAEGVEQALSEIKDPKLREAFRTTWNDRGAIFGERGVEGIEEVYNSAAGRGGLLSRKAKGKGVRRGLDPTSSEFYGYRANFAAAGRVEKMARGPLMIDGLMKGMDPDAALQRVMTHHFDYSELSHMEERWLKRIIPFYTWTRNNVPVMTEYIARKPGGVMWYLHAKRNIEAHSEAEDVVPRYFQEAGAIRTPFQVGSDTPGQGDTGGGQFYAAPDLPFLNLNDTFNFSQLMSQVSPLIKAPYEISAGKKVFNDAPLKDDVTEVPQTWNWAMPLLQVTSGFAGMPKVIREDGRYFMSDKDLYKIEQAAPALGRARRLLPSEDRYAEREFTSILSTVFGFGSFTNGDRQQGIETYLRNMEMQKAMRKDSQIEAALAGEE